MRERGREREAERERPRERGRERESSLNSSGHGLYKVLKVFHRDAIDSKASPQLCPVGWMSFEWWTILETHRKLLTVKKSQQRCSS